MIQSHTFSGKEAGKSVLIFGAIHGNEVCGPKAIKRVMNEIKNSNIILQSGTVTFVPICNPRAFEQNVRSTEDNLNRIFVLDDNPKTYEAQLAQALIPYVDKCDILLDVHSFSTQGSPFVFQDAPEAKVLAAATGFPIVMTGWIEMFEGTEGANEGDTAAYALAQSKEAVVIECGQHQDPKAVDLAYQAILNTLAYAGMIKEEIAQTTHTKHIHLETVFFYEKEGHFTKEWQHGDAFQKGQLIAQYSGGKRVCAPHEGYILLPKNQFIIGREWFYFGKEVK